MQLIKLSEWKTLIKFPATIFVLNRIWKNLDIVCKGSQSEKRDAKLIFKVPKASNAKSNGNEVSVC